MIKHKIPTPIRSKIALVFFFLFCFVSSFAISKFNSNEPTVSNATQALMYKDPSLKPFLLKVQSAFKSADKRLINDLFKWDGLDVADREQVHRQISEIISHADLDDLLNHIKVFEGRVHSGSSFKKQESEVSTHDAVNMPPAYFLEFDLTIEHKGSTALAMGYDQFIGRSTTGELKLLNHVPSSSCRGLSQSGKVDCYFM